MGDALKKIPKTAANNEITRQSPQVVEQQHIKPGKNAWNSKIQKDFQLNVSKAKLSQIYKRLKKNEPSYTITGSGGGGTHVYHIGLKIGPTNREGKNTNIFQITSSFMEQKSQSENKLECLYHQVLYR